MELEIKLFSDFKCYAPGSENVFSISISSGVTVAEKAFRRSPVTIVSYRDPSIARRLQKWIQV